MNVAIIPARGGSKRIPRKNIKEFAGKPIIAWSIEAAQASNCFDTIIVSTDDVKIAAVAKEYGAEVPFMRPSSLADDQTATLPVLSHAVAAYESASNSKIDLACCIYATAPFLQSKYLKAGLRELREDKELDFAFSATSYVFPIQRALKLTPTGNVEMFFPNYEQSRSQDLEASYHDAAQFYWFRPKALHCNKGIFSSQSKAIILPRESVQDIDNPEDWDYAEKMFNITRKTDH